jgi:hypothetical protein
MARTHSLERVGLRPIDKIEVLRDLDRVTVRLCGEQPKVLRYNSTANRYIFLSPSHARRVASRSIEAASKVERKSDTYGFWNVRKENRS